MREDFERRKPIKAFARSAVQGKDETLEDGIGDSGYIRILGYALSEETVSVLVRPSLPRRMRVRKEERHVFQLPRNIAVGGKFMTSVRRHRLCFVRGREAKSRVICPQTTSESEFGTLAARR